VRAGITTMDHGSVLDDEILEEMKDRGTWLVPTMMACESVIEMGDAGILPPGPTPKTLDIAPLVVESHRRAFAAGVPVAFGTDAGVFAHGRNAREFQLMVEAGLSPPTPSSRPPGTPPWRLAGTTWVWWSPGAAPTWWPCAATRWRTSPCCSAWSS
jgi:hypothetical protein